MRHPDKKTFPTAPAEAQGASLVSRSLDPSSSLGGADSPVPVDFGKPTELLRSHRCKTTGSSGGAGMERRIESTGLDRPGFL